MFLKAICANVLQTCNFNKRNRKKKNLLKTPFIDHAHFSKESGCRII